MSSNVTTLFFDLDDTLFDKAYSQEQALLAIQKDNPNTSHLSLDQIVTYLLAIDGAYQDLYNGYNTGGGLYQGSFVTWHRLGIFPPTEKEMRRTLELYNAVTDQTRRATPGALAMLERMKKLGYEIAIITNGGLDYQTRLAKQLGVAKFVKSIFAVDRSLRWMKPDPQTFRNAMKEMGVRPEEALMIGYDAIGDVVGARGVGMCQVLWDPSVEGRERRVVEGEMVDVIGDWVELEGLLESWNVSDMSDGSDEDSVDFAKYGKEALRESRKSSRSVVSRVVGWLFGLVKRHST